MSNSKQLLNDLQNEQNELMHSLRHPRLGTITSFVEEVGELIKSLHEREIYGNNSKDILQNTKEEVADCFFSLLEIANAYKIDLGTAYEEKLNKIESKIADWEKEYGPTLKRARAKLD